MSKPWVQEWRVDEDGVEVGEYDVIDNDAFVVASVYARDDVGDPDKASEERARLIAAAPDMARALLNLYDNARLFNRDSDAAWRALDAEVRSALKKAGVPL